MVIRLSWIEHFGSFPKLPTRHFFVLYSSLSITFSLKTDFVFCQQKLQNVNCGAFFDREPHETQQRVDCLLEVYQLCTEIDQRFCNFFKIRHFFLKFKQNVTHFLKTSKNLLVFVQFYSNLADKFVRAFPKVIKLPQVSEKLSQVRQIVAKISKCILFSKYF